MSQIYCTQTGLTFTHFDFFLSAVGELHPEKCEAEPRQHTVALCSQPDGHHAGDRDEPPDAHGGADAQTQRGRSQGNESPSVC